MARKFNRILSLSVIILILPVVLVAQGVNKSFSEQDLGLQFLIDENFKLESFTGSSISYKIQKSKNHAYRLGLGIETLSNSGNEPGEAIGNEIADLDLNLSLNLRRLNYVNPDDDIKLFYGYGPSIGAGYRILEEANGDQGLIETTTSEIILSAVGLIGVEWFFHNSMSLHAEYQSALDVTWLNEEMTTDNTQTGEEVSGNYDNTSYRFGGDGVKFGLTIYY